MEGTRKPRGRPCLPDSKRHIGPGVGTGCLVDPVADERFGNKPESTARGENLRPEVPILAVDEGEVRSKPDSPIAHCHVDQQTCRNDGILPPANPCIEWWLCFDSLIVPKELGPGRDRMKVRVSSECNRGLLNETGSEHIVGIDQYKEGSLSRFSTTLSWGWHHSRHS